MKKTVMKIDKKYIYLITIVLIILLVLPTIITAFYSVHYYDDFSNANALAYSLDDNILTKIKFAYDFTINYYFKWQGTYSLFFGGLFSPLNGFGRPQLVTISVLFAILTPILIFETFSRIGKNFGIPDSHRMILLVLFAFYIYNVNAFQEVFYWYQGIVIYTFPICCFCGAVLLLEKFLLHEKKIDIVFCIIFLFIAMGGSLEVAGFACMLMLLLFAMFFRRLSKRQRKISIVILSFAILFALINAFAPGNYVRYGQLSSNKLSIIKMINALFVSFYQTVLQIIRTLVLKHYILFGCIAFVLGLRNKEKANISLIHSLLFILLPIITIYPIALGQGFGFSAVTIQNRYEYLFDLSIIITTLVLGYSTGNSLKIKKHMKSSLTIFMIFSSVFVWVVYPTDIELMSSRITADNLINGRLQSYSNEIYKVYEKIEDSEENPIIIETLPERVYGFIYIELSNDSEYWINNNISHYYKSGKIIGPGISE